MSLDHNIVLFHYPSSPWARKIRVYLALRKIPYTELHVNMTMPRPVLEQLNINFRLIPILAIGRDMYTNTVLQLQVLDHLIPACKEHPPLSASQREQSGQAIGLEKLMEKYTEGMFLPGTAALSPGLYEGVEGFKEDRKSLWGTDWDGETQRKRMPEAQATLVGCFELLESVLGEGGKWIGGDEAGLVDIHAAWLFTWLLEIKQLPEDFFNQNRFPKTMEYLQNYQSLIHSAMSSAKVTEVNDSKAVELIEASNLPSPPKSPNNDPLNIKIGEEASVYPKGTNRAHRDTGELVVLNLTEAVVKKLTKNRKEIRVHYTRWKTKIERAGPECDQNGLAAHERDEGLGAEH